MALFGIIYVAIIFLVAILAPVIAPYPYDKIQPALGFAFPSREYLLGNDQLGRDILSRIIFGARPMLLVGILTNLIATVIGVPLGVVAGYVGGALDWIVTRLVDLFSALPWYLMVLYMVMVLSPSLQNLILALSITGWVGSCRLVRGMTLSLREQDYVEAARALGLPTWRILFFHILPQAAPLLIWGFAAGIPTAVFAEAGLSFLGMGVRPPQPSWGQMLAETGTYWSYFPHAFLAPAVMITLSVLAFQTLADGIREAIDVNVNL
jgi:ABC-type dipeptide/oligopeptide/nickel transport system permease subunit